MRKFCLTIGLIILLNSVSLCQNLREKISSDNIQSTTIDTINEKIIVVHKRYATIYFKQADIQQYIKQSNRFGLPDNENFIIVNAFLRANKKRIDLKDWTIEYSDEEKKHNFTLRRKQDFDQFAMPEMLYIGFNLIHTGKFMIINNLNGKIINEGLKLVTYNTELGIKNFQAQLPSGFTFWRTITIIGDY